MSTHYDDALDQIELEFLPEGPEHIREKNEKLSAEIASSIRKKTFEDAQITAGVKSEAYILRDDDGLMIGIVGDGYMKTFERDSLGNIVKVIEEREA